MHFIPANKQRQNRCYQFFLAVVCCGLLLAIDAHALSKKKAAEIGRKAYAEIIQQTPPYPDKELQAYINDLGQLLVSHSELADMEWRFTVLDNPQINAFVTPGGYVYINTGLLTYIQSEAQLAGVIGHEIGHLTGKHPDRQRTAAGWSKALSTIAAVAVGVTTGSGQAAGATGNLGNLASAALVSGYGRDMELEADEAGAKYLLKAGYSPQAMVDVIAVLKDQERFARMQARESGKKPVAYHGVFSTHPRNDQRLQNVVKAVGTLPPGAVERGNDGRFAQNMEGFKFLNNPLMIKTDGSRYLNRPMDFTVAFPSGWTVKSKDSVIQAKGHSDGAVVQIRAKRRPGKDVSPEQYLRVERNFSNLIDGEEIGDDKTPGFTGIVPESESYPRRRIAVIYHKSRAFLFVAQVDKGKYTSFYDTLFMASLWSFRQLNEYDRSIALSRQVTWLQAPAGTTFADLAAKSPVKQFAEAHLRLMNGYYPYGEPKANEWIRIIE